MPIAKQTIAIIGAGRNMGTVIANSTAGANYRLLLLHKSPDQIGFISESIQKAHSEADLKSMDCPHESCWEADIIFLAIPHEAEKDMADKIRDVATQKIRVSIASPADENFSKLRTTHNTSMDGDLY